MADSPTLPSEPTLPGDPTGRWYYCFKHDKVETQDDCRRRDRMGPYATREDAENWRERVADRNAEWDRKDREEKG